MTGKASIRLSRPADAGVLAAIHIEGWRAAYQDIFPPEAFAARTVEKRQAEWEEYFASPPAESRVWVKCVGEHVVGFAYTRAGADADIPDGGELKLFYVAPNLRGGGIGLALFRHAVADMEARGMSPYLYTLKANEAARAWYERRHWIHDGAEAPWSDAGEYPDIREVRYRPAQMGAPAH